MIEAFAPINEDELTLAARNQALPAWVLVERNAQGHVLVLLLQHLADIPHERLRGWSPLAVVGLDCDRAYTNGLFAPGEMSIRELLGW